MQLTKCGHINDDGTKKNNLTKLCLQRTILDF